MAIHQRRSFYFNEENQDLFAFLKTKKRANEWVMQAIRQQMLYELNPTTAPASAPGLSTETHLQSLIQRLEALEASQSAQATTVVTTPQPITHDTVEPVVEPLTPTPPVHSVSYQAPAISIQAKPKPKPAPAPLDIYGGLDSL